MQGEFITLPIPCQRYFRTFLIPIQNIFQNKEKNKKRNLKLPYE